MRQKACRAEARPNELEKRLHDTERKEQEHLATYHQFIIAKQREASWRLRGERMIALQPHESWSQQARREWNRKRRGFKV